MSFRYVDFELLVRFPSRDVQQAVEYDSEIQEMSGSKIQVQKSLVH